MSQHSLKDTRLADYLEDIGYCVGWCLVLAFARHFVNLSIVCSGKPRTVPKLPPVAKNI